MMIIAKIVQLFFKRKERKEKRKEKEKKRKKKKEKKRKERKKEILPLVFPSILFLRYIFVCKWLHNLFKTFT